MGIWLYKGEKQRRYDTKAMPAARAAPSAISFETLARNRTNTHPHDTKINAAGRSVRACLARKSKAGPSTSE